jgi:ABC-2 type transport system ATP-binding protein
MESADRAKREYVSALRVVGLTKAFGSVHALAGLDLDVAYGQIVGLIGPNGAGKTTAIRAMLGLIQPDEGEILLDGAILDGVAPSTKIGALVDRPGVYPYLSGRRNLEIAALALGTTRGAAATVGRLLALVGLADVADRRVKTYSAGERQRLGVALALVGDPRVLILDEPASGLDPWGIADLRTLLRDLAMQGRAVMLSSHLLDEVEQICDQVSVMDRGRVVASGTPTALRGSSVELDITFSDEAIAEAALALIVAGGGKATRCGPTVIVGGQGDPETLSRRLWQAGLFPTELKRVPRRLEETFFELTSDSNNADR